MTTAKHGKLKLKFLRSRSSRKRKRGGVFSSNQIERVAGKGITPLEPLKCSNLFL